MPILEHSSARRTRPSGLVSMSVSLCSVGTNSSSIFFFSTHSRMKWCFNSICFEHSWKTGFLASLIVDLLSTLNTTYSASLLLNSVSNRACQIPWQAALAAAMYSDSHLERVMIFCFWNCQVTGMSPEGTTCYTYSCASRRPHPSRYLYSRLGVVHLYLCHTYIRVEVIR